ncbi:glycine cleavage system aminomethyltransferase GcvT [Salimicrobium salexigens]|uniref:Aminomethyltransferase n=1 Tax=Salimicrobium salexigens TaxID=908941 RepID=A0ABY1KNI1_9BACI|nr:glycine cleavage system aminomethyltransferase GcvT [Salimicrobium salexigens]SIS53698.1 aminomethyltransferase [Salimicrobium salexigens]
MDQQKKTPLYEEFVRLGAKTINFGGWQMPVQFTGIKKEHAAVREAAGLFDVSHMGEISVKGEKATAFLNSVLTNDVEKLSEGRAQYTMMCYENGGTVDDLIVYYLNKNEYLLVVNAANKDKDLEWLLAHQTGGVEIDDVSAFYAQLAIQGPKAEEILQSLTDTQLQDIKFFRFHAGTSFDGVDGKALVSRTGYTGEDGFEIYLPASSAVDLWKACLEAGEEYGIQPVGLGARDTLRFEAGLPLYSQELSENITPVEAGLGFAVKIDKEANYPGKAVLKKQKQSGVGRKLAGIEMLDKGIPRTGYEVYDEDGENIGFVTSGTQSPTLGKNLGLAIVKKEYTDLDQIVYVEVRKKMLKAKIINTPFYKR